MEQLVGVGGVGVSGDDIEVNHAGGQLQMLDVVCFKGRILICWKYGW